MAVIWWLRRDLRLDDNTALGIAIERSAGAVLPLFVLDDGILQAPTTAPARVQFLLESLRELAEALRERGSQLIVRRGDPVAEVCRLLDESDAEGVCFNRDYEPYAQRRDAAVIAAVAARGKWAISSPDQLLAEPDELPTNEGKVATIYTPYARRWLARLEAKPDVLAKRTDRDRLGLQSVALVESLPVPRASDLGFALTQTVQPAGENAGKALLKAFVQGDQTGLRTYHEQRNRLAVAGTSRLGPHLRFGTVGARTAVRVALALRDRTTDAEERKGCTTWIGELAWRDFYFSILANFPRVVSEPFKPLFNHFPFRTAPAEYAAWCEGRTGYPVVDAAMRQLNQEAFMHNRARMISASFLIKHLLLDYRQGEQYFMRQLACGDTAANNGGWQWVAGSGNDGQPYFRIFNPMTQSHTYDPDGAYIRRYLPELAAVPDEYIHAPWTMPAPVAQRAGVQIGRDYPAPIVDHKQARDRALAALASAKAAANERG